MTLAKTNQISRAWSCDQAKAKITQQFIHTETSQLFRPVLDFQKFNFWKFPNNLYKKPEETTVRSPNLFLLSLSIFKAPFCGELFCRIGNLFVVAIFWTIFFGEN